MTREMERTEVAARESIRELLATYTWAADRGQAKEVAACFLTEGTLDVDVHGGRWEGRARIETELVRATERARAADGKPVRLSHHVTSSLIHLDSPASGTVRSYFQVLGPHGLDHWGRYLDRVLLSPADGGWRFAERAVLVDGHAPDSVMVPALDGP